MPQGEQVLDRHSCAAAIVDQDRAHIRSGVDIDRHERKPPAPGEFDQPVAVLDALDDEAVDERAVDAPRRLLAIGRRDQRDARRRAGRRLRRRRS